MIFDASDSNSVLAKMCQNIALGELAVAAPLAVAAALAVAAVLAVAAAAT